MTVAEFKKTYKNVIGVDSLNENQNVNLLTILGYIFSELKDCTFNITSIESIDSLTIQSNNCKDKLQALNNKYLTTYKNYGLNWTNSGNYSTLSVSPSSKNTTTPSPNDNKSTNTSNSANWVKDLFKPGIQSFLNATNLSENVINEIQRIKKLL
jgi:hypothetical protein